MKDVSDEIKKALKLWYDGGNLNDNTPRENAGDTLIDHLEDRLRGLEAENKSLRNCGNCLHSSSSGANQICVGCHGYSDVLPKSKKTYLAKWEMKKHDI